IDPAMDGAAFRRLLYRNPPRAISDRLRLAIAVEQGKDPEGEALAGYVRLLEALDQWQRPRFPIAGKDLVQLGMEPGAAMGQVLRTLENDWIEADFAWTRDELLARAAAIADRS